MERLTVTDLHRLSKEVGIPTSRLVEAILRCVHEGRNADPEG